MSGSLPTVADSLAKFPALWADLQECVSPSPCERDISYQASYTRSQERSQTYGWKNEVYSLEPESKRQQFGSPVEVVRERRGQGTPHGPHGHQKAREVGTFSGSLLCRVLA